MPENIQTKTITLRELNAVLKDVKDAVEKQRTDANMSEQKIKDLRWKFDQVSAKMNQAIYNDQVDQIHQSCLATVAILIEILSRQP
jgi:phage shock protein A